jgi:hypothetical protein
MHFMWSLPILFDRSVIYFCTRFIGVWVITPGLWSSSLGLKQVKAPACID